ncbi:hypothetical protein NPIL_203331 [Nephila pilipes]|uniref:Uncharacterized protein n=1 Tax=Nephila pilipes TaxID=299642 RepID=A0A8X6UEH6_NEPPI|nr:hypothetical protein NPIL_203331 [Nephila pilipes]
MDLHFFVARKKVANKQVISFKSYRRSEKFRRLTAWIQRFFRNARKDNENNDSRKMRIEELEDTEIYWVKYIQKENYPEEFKALKTNEPIPNYSKIFKLSPFSFGEWSTLGKGKATKCELHLNSQVFYCVIVKSSLCKNNHL